MNCFFGLINATFEVIALSCQAQLAIVGILAHQGAFMQDNIASWKGLKETVSK